MNEPKMNVELLLKVRDHIANIGERGGRFAMERIGQRIDESRAALRAAEGGKDA